MFKIYNTKTREKQEFIPLEQGKVRIYSCGPTVYNYFHIGNARPFIVFDTLRRYLKWRGYDVTFVQNFTDIDDKMISKANADGITVKELGERFIKEYYVDAEALGIRPPDVAPKATEHMADIIGLVKTLVDKGYAYESGGDVYFDTAEFKAYGQLTGQNLEDLQLGARIDITESKRNPMDFALWKAQKPDEPAWDSPWGKGRPGWHIECSAMSMKYLGDTLDIHCGGQDLVFPHHENETAQSEAATGKPFANYWMHNGYININNRKMSKSAGNFFTVRDIAKEFDLMAVRMFMLSAHYRNPVNFSRDLIIQAKSAFERIQNCRSMLLALPDADETANDALTALLQNGRDGFIQAMDDDLNTADALGVIFELVRELNAAYAGQKCGKGALLAVSALDELLDVLGLVPEDAEIPAEITGLAERRQEARRAKDWNESDRLRDEIALKGYIVEDTPQGYQIKKA